MTALITVLHGITVWKGFEYVTGSCWAAIVSYQGHDLTMTILVLKIFYDYGIVQATEMLVTLCW